MQLSIKLASKGEGKVSPNPLVGSVLVKDGKIIGSGYHKKFGDYHAEVNAIASAGGKTKGATLYVNLEPCSFYGKTPPCTWSIINAGVKKVYCSILDPNPKVNGKGLKSLRASGIQVEVGLLSREAEKLNEAYLKYITTGIPWVILKIAQTLDGKIATASGDSKWITSEDSRKFVHELRSKVDAVLVGSGTVIKDDPELTSHSKTRRNPRRVVLTTSQNLPPISKIFRINEDGKTIIVTPEVTSKLKVHNAEIWVVKKNKEGKIDLKKFLKKAGEKEVTSIMIEGGKEIFTSFLKYRLADKIYYFISPGILGKGLETFGDLGIETIKDSLKLRGIELKKFSRDFLITGYL